MVEVRSIRESDLPAFRRLHNRYVDRDESLDTVREWYAESPEFLLGAYDGEALVGHALGRPRSAERLELAGISVEESHRRQGIGSALLDAVEDRAVAHGFERVSLGSAGGYVDEFYAANGYRPESVLVRLDADSAMPETVHEVVAVRTEDGTRKLYVAPGNGGPDHLDAVRGAFDDPEAIYIMAKDLDGP